MLCALLVLGGTCILLCTCTLPLMCVQRASILHIDAHSLRILLHAACCLLLHAACCQLHKNPPCKLHQEGKSFTGTRYFCSTHFPSYTHNQGGLLYEDTMCTAVSLMAHNRAKNNRTNPSCVVRFLQHTAQLLNNSAAHAK